MFFRVKYFLYSTPCTFGFVQYRRCGIDYLGAFDIYPFKLIVIWWYVFVIKQYSFIGHVVTMTGPTGKIATNKEGKEKKMVLVHLSTINLHIIVSVILVMKDGN